MPLRRNDPRQAARFYLGDCLEVVGSLPESSVDLVVADPPYHRVKGEAWDRQWKTDADYLAWVGRLCEGWRRVLRPNGSLYVFASPRMAARVECKVGEYFEVLNHVVWAKLDEATHAAKYGEDRFRQYVQKSERIIFAEQSGADAISSLATAVREARTRAELTFGDIDVSLGYVRTKDRFRGTDLCRRWEEASSVPSEGDFCRALGVCGDGRSREELKSLYWLLLEEYARNRRPFTVSADVPYTDVWDFPTVQHYPGKHPCEKPTALLRHIVTASSREGAVVLDPFMGGGSLGTVCRDTGRRYIGIEMGPHWYTVATRRVARATANGSLLKE